MNVAAQSDVVKNGRPLEEFNLLKGPGDAQFGPFIRFYPGNLFSFKIDLAFLRVVEAIDAIEKNRFPRTVRAYDRKNLPSS